MTRAEGAVPAPAYRGRFAPTPSGPLHVGSLLTAVASYLDAKAHGGAWFLRIDDLDPPRVAPGAAEAILRALEAHGLRWDGSVQYQHDRGAAYAAAFEVLQRMGAVYPCACTRREIADSNPERDKAGIYPGTCRAGLGPGKVPRAWRLDTRGARVALADRLLGEVTMELDTACGDFVVRRADAVFAYQLAAVVDDAALGITDVVRGVDLLDSSSRQIHLQRLLGLATPRYLHLPVVVNADGEKLSKQTLAPALAPARAPRVLSQALELLGHAPPRELVGAPPPEQLDWAVAHWNSARLPAVRSLPQPVANEA